MAGGLASRGGIDVWLSSLQHPTHAMPVHCTQRNKIISQFVAPYFAPAHHCLANWMDNLGQLCQWPLVNRSSETISPRSNCPCPGIFSTHSSPSFCCTSHYALTSSLLHQSYSLWLILNQSQHTAFPQERPVLLEDPILGKNKEYTQQSPIPTVPRRTLLLLAAKPQGELHQQ